MQDESVRIISDWRGVAGKGEAGELGDRFGGTRRRAWPTEAGEKEAVFSATLIMLGLT